jgi:serine/threonine protein kinase
MEDRLAIGSVLDGRYRIDGLVGIGGMGSVYRCEHTGIGRPVAIKVLHASYIGNREASTRFQREAIASGRLEHPNIVGVSDFGLLSDGGCYLVMELLEGESLGDRLAREKIPWRDAIEILGGVLRGLRHAHTRGVVHRDIKPDNVFLAVKDGDPITKILDFGIAKLFAGAEDDPAATRLGITVGTPAYLSPEQAVGGEITPASDLYSSSVLLFEMLTGRPPFDDKDPMAMLGAHVGRPPPRIEEVAPEVEVPEGLEAILRRGLAKTPAERFTSCNQYLTALAQLFPKHPAGFGRATGSTTAIQDRANSPNEASSPTLPTQPPVLTRELPPAPRGDATVIAPPSAAQSLARRIVSLADHGEPIPRSWITGGGVLLAALIVFALIISVFSGDKKAAPGSTAAAPAVDPEIQALIAEGRASLQRRLNDALALVENGKECKERKAALEQIVAEKYPNALTGLEQLRPRVAAGKDPKCLAAELNAAIKGLSGSATPRPGQTSK